MVAVTQGFDVINLYTVYEKDIKQHLQVHCISLYELQLTISFL